MSTLVLSLTYGFLRHVAEPAARSLVLACFAMIAVFVFRIRTVSWKTAIWRAVLVAALAMPLLGLFLPSIRLPLPVPELRTYPIGVTESDAPQTIPAARIMVVPSSAASFEAPVLPARKTGSIPWAPILIGVYLAIALGLLARVFVGAAFGDRLARRAIPVRDGAALRQLSLLARRTGLRAQPLLAESNVLAVPVTLRVRRPAILLPVSWSSWGAAKLSAVLAHEVSHVARRDAMVQRFALIHRAVFWFSPLGWWLVRHLNDLAEQSSDEAALACGIERTQYAEALLGFAAALEGCRTRVWWQGVAMAKRGCAEKRLDRILAWRTAMPNELRKSFFVTLAVLAAPVVALTASVHPAFFSVLQSPAPVAPAKAPRAPEPSPAIAPVVSSSPVPEAPPSLPTPAVALAPSIRVMAKPARTLEPPTVTPAVSFAPVAPAMMAGQPVPAAASLTTQVGATSEVPPGTVSGATTVGVYGQETYGGVYDHSGPRFVIVTKGSNSVIMSGSSEDAEHAKSLRSKISGDFIWFERDEKPYIIRDEATVQRAMQFWKPMQDLDQQQEALGKQQEALGRQQEALGLQTESVRVKIPDLSAEMEKVEAQMKQLSAKGGTVEQIGDLQSEIGDLQGRIGEVQSQVGTQQSEIGREQSNLGLEQGELGRRQGEIGRRQGELSRQASQQMKQLLDDAIAHGLAQSE
ncbi:MAG: M56 family metallopeptidase [Candidatus Acidiferrales bacterium]